MKKFLVALSAMMATSSAFALNCGHPDVVFAQDSIVRYLQVRPTAADTVEGVHQFWIAWPYGGSEPIDYTVKALSCLKDKGVMEEVKFGARTLWRHAR